MKTSAPATRRPPFLRTAVLLFVPLVVGAQTVVAQQAPGVVAQQKPGALSHAQAPGVWSRERARAWADSTGWLVGSNFAPSTAINQLEMWQAATFDPKTIDRELGWAESLGMNTMRVFLHDLLWTQDSSGFLNRIDQFLTIAQRRHIRPMFVLFDAVWDPLPHLGKQRAPIPHLHNSGWVQSPGAAILSDTARYDQLRGYVQGVVGRFAKDRRVVAWDIFNEPDNTNRPAYIAYEPINKPALTLILMRKAFEWARGMNPSQPLTAAPWLGDYVDPARMRPATKFMLDNSDVITFHSYDDSAAVEKLITALERYGRPIICSEYMARPRGSTFQKILPIFARRHVGAINWGFVSGKTQTIYPWDSWNNEYTSEPTVWFHDIFRANGVPYDSAEVRLIRTLMRPASHFPLPASRFPSIMKPRLQEVHTVVADEINQSVFACDAR